MQKYISLWHIFWGWYLTLIVYEVLIVKDTTRNILSL